MDEMIAAMAEVAAENVRLRKALRPFAVEGSKLTYTDDDDSTRYNTSLKNGHFRDAMHAMIGKLEGE